MKLKRDRCILLLDYYGTLLTAHQRDILDEYFNDDLSMNELSENYNISKSAISDLINRSVQQMEDYDESLHLIKTGHNITLLIEEMRNENDDVIHKYADKLEKINRG